MVRERYHPGAESTNNQVRCLKTIVLCLLLLVVPLQGIATAPMAFCGDQGDMARISATPPSAQKNVDQDTAGAVEPSWHGVVAQVDDRGGCPDCQCRVCGACCTAAGLPSTRDALSTLLGRAGLCPFGILDPLKGRIPSTLDRPPPAPRPTRVV